MTHDIIRVPIPEPWPAPPPIASASQSRITADELNKRAEVESILLNVYAGKRPMLTREECKALAFRLGVPSEYQRPEWLLPLEGQS